MRYGIVEGEPGIFPDPVTRLLLRLTRRLRKGTPPEERAEKPEDGEPLPPQ